MKQTYPVATMENHETNGGRAVAGAALAAALSVGTFAVAVAPGLGTSAEANTAHTAVDPTNVPHDDFLSTGKVVALKKANVGGCPNVAFHRGAPNRSKHVAENTMGAFRLAEAAGAPTLETDVRRDRSGVLDIYHDKTLQPIARNASGPIAAKSHGAIAKVRLKNGGRIPTLDKVLDFAAANDMRVQVEGKPYPGVEKDAPRIVDKIEKRDMVDKTMLTSSRPAFLKAVRAENGGILRGMIIADKTPASAINLDGIALYADSVNIDILHIRQRPNIVQEIHDKGLLVSVRGFSAQDVPKLVDAHRNHNGKLQAGKDAVNNLVLDYYETRHGRSDGAAVMRMCRSILAAPTPPQPSESPSPTPTPTETPSPTESPSVTPTPTETPTPTPTETPTVTDTPTPTPTETPTPPAETVPAAQAAGRFTRLPDMVLQFSLVSPDGVRRDVAASYTLAA